MNNPKTCAYTISLNEEAHIESFMKACKDVDTVIVCDTGSTDNTVSLLKELGAVVYKISQKPWRFDIPRNTALNLVPENIDICFSIDIDEQLQPGWKEALNKTWRDSNKTINRIKYDYVWNWKKDATTPDIRFFAEKFHSRHGYIWKHPCHEGLYWQNTKQEIVVTIPEIKLHHRADPNKSRGQYLPLLKLAVIEDPLNDRMAFYYARELMYHNDLDESARQFKRFLSLESSTWDQERGAAMRFLSRVEPDKTEYWLIKALQECPQSRETLVKLCNFYFDQEKYDLAYTYGLNALKITEPNGGYLIESYAWNETVYDLIAISAYNIGLVDKARIYGTKALSMRPNDQRLINNLRYYNQ